MNTKYIAWTEHDQGNGGKHMRTLTDIETMMASTELFEWYEMTITARLMCIVAWQIMYRNNTL